MRTRALRISSLGAALAVVATLVIGTAGPAAAAPAEPAFPVATYLAFDSDPGDWVGGGVDDTWYTSDGPFTASHVGGLVTVGYDGPGSEWWTLRFEAPSGTDLVTGAYDGAVRWRSQVAGQPGLDVSGSGRGCNKLSGRFDVLEAVYGPSGSVVRFAADFEQHCENGGPALRGSIRYQASPAFWNYPDGDADGVPDTFDGCPTAADPDQADADHDGIGDVCDPGFERTSLTVVSEPGDPMGGGQSGTWYPVDGRFQTGRVTGLVAVTVASPDWWTISFMAPDGAELTQGAYEGATRYAHRSTPTPGLLASWVGRSCTTVTGRFDVLEAVYRADGTVERFAADFEQHCNGAAAALRGSIRINASAGLPAAPDADADGVADTLDVCPATWDATQADADHDGLGDACDPTPIASLTATDVVFADTEVGATTAVQTVTVHNVGNGPLVVSWLGLLGTDPGDFAVSTDCTQGPVAVGGSCAVGVTFAPGAAGARSAALALTTNDLVGSHAIFLRGLGTLPPPPPVEPPAPPGPPTPAPPPPPPIVVGPGEPPTTPILQADTDGYWMLGRDGAVYPFGDAHDAGRADAGAGPAVDLEPTPGGGGYWIAHADGHVSARGDALVLGDASADRHPEESVTSLSATPTGRGYWLFTDAGRVIPRGDATWYGDLSAQRLNGPVLDSVATPSGHGYYLVASDGGVFAFGDARFVGSMGGQALNAPVQSLVPDGDGGGYWLVATDGGIFAFDAPFLGSMGGADLNAPITGMVAGSTGRGYLMVAEDGGIFAFGDVAFRGSLGATPPPSPITAVASLP